MQQPVISIVVPLYNEEQVIPKLVERLNGIIDSFTEPIEVVLVDDGSRDRTSEMIHQIALTHPSYTAIILSRNFGHSAALSAGLKVASGSEAVFIIDGDLQDPPELIHDFYRLICNGNEVVYGVRQKRKENAFKKAAYHVFYRLLNSISKIDIPLDSGDFCMLHRKVVDVMNAMPEESRFLRGMRSWIGFRQVAFPYERQERKAGKSKYTLGKLIQLALNGIFNFSEIPIRLIFFVGVMAFLIAVFYLGYALVQRFFYHQAPQVSPAYYL